MSSEHVQEKTVSAPVRGPMLNIEVINLRCLIYQVSEKKDGDNKGQDASFQFSIAESCQYIPCQKDFTN